MQQRFFGCALAAVALFVLLAPYSGMMHVAQTFLLLLPLFSLDNACRYQRDITEDARFTVVAGYACKREKKEERRREEEGKSSRSFFLNSSLPLPPPLALSYAHYS
jgi:hypothetical protein